MDWDILLKIWAVVGPLIAAGASAVWARRNQLQDRAHDIQQQHIARENALEDKHLEFQRSALSNHKSELRSEISQFVAAANTYLEISHRNRDGRGNPETESLELEGLATLNAHFHAVHILGTDEIANLARNVHNLATDFPVHVAKLDAEKQKEHHEKYMQAKKELATSARKLLGLKGDA